MQAQNTFYYRTPLVTASVFSYHHFVASHCHIVWISFYLDTSSLATFSLFYDLIASHYTKGKWHWRRGYLFCFEYIILITKYFFPSLYFSPFNLKSLLNQKLTSLKAKFCFFDWQKMLHRASRLEMLCEKGVRRNFAKYTGKHLYQSFIFNKVTSLCKSLFFDFIKKETLAPQVFSCEFCEISKNTFF